MVGRDALILFLLALLFGGFACALGYRVMWCVARAGHPVKVFATVFDTIRVFRVYRQLAPTRGWPLWPIMGFWVLSGIAFVFGIAAALSLPPRLRTAGRPPQSLRGYISPTFLAWISLAAALQSLWFTYQVLHKLPRNVNGKQEWKELLRNEYVRSDFYGAAIGWVGLVRACPAFS
ncbi:MAG: hypothetical protein HY237_06400 [Acidobacteria bacterium]|nr:hypothetical protein [Acidobacteriota bacterium]